MEDIIRGELLKTAQVLESGIDAEIGKLDHLSSYTFEKFNEEIDVIRSQRLEKLKKEAAQRKEYLSKGHGTYEELPTEKDFFTVNKSSDNVVVHFFQDGNEKSKILDHHLKQLCSMHLETHFTKLNLKRCNFLKDSLNIKKCPILICVSKNIIKGRITDFNDISDISSYNLKLLEWKIAQFDCMVYEEDLSQPPSKFGSSKKNKSLSVRSIRGPAFDDNSDSD